MDRTASITEWVDEAIKQLRLIRGLVKKDKHVDPSEFDDVRVMIDSLRHHVEMHNQERLAPKA